MLRQAPGLKQIKPITMFLNNIDRQLLLNLIIIIAENSLTTARIITKPTKEHNISRKNELNPLCTYPCICMTQNKYCRLVGHNFVVLLVIFFTQTNAHVAYPRKCNN
jgi:hypothetical protein